MKLFFWILAGLISLAAGYWVYRTDKKRSVPYPALLASLRALIVFLTFLLLLAPLINIHKNETQKPIVLFLQDNSESVANALKTDSTAYQNNARALLSKLKNDYRVIEWGFGERIQKDSLFQFTHQATDISNAISQAVEYYGQQNLGAIILASDGRFNQGLDPRFQELAYQGNLFTVVLGDTSAEKDIRISTIYANKTVALNSQFDIRADVLAEYCSGYNKSIELKEINGNASGSVPVSITTDQFDKSVSFSVKADKIGMHHYRIAAINADGERNTINNQKDVFVEVVSEKKNILIAAAAPHPDVNAIRDALSGLENYAVHIRTGTNIPADLSSYDVLILHALPALGLPLPQLSKPQKPVWYIVGQGTDVASVSQMQIARLNVNTLNLQNNFAQFQSSFSSFVMPASVHAVMDKMPPLASPLGTVESGANAAILFTGKANKQPIWLLQQNTTPRALLAGEGLWRWRLYEYRFFNSHNVIDEAIRQTVAFLSVNVNEKPFRIELPKHIWSDREPVSMSAFLLNTNNEQVNSADVKIVITDSAGNKSYHSFERSGTIYQLNIGTRAAGNYSYSGQVTYNGKTYTSSGNFTVQNMPLERMRTGADFALLHHLSNKYDGASVLYPNVSTLYDSIRLNDNIKPVIQSTNESIPLIDWKWFFFLILSLAVVEWLLRKYWMAQ